MKQNLKAIGRGAAYGLASAVLSVAVLSFVAGCAKTPAVPSGPVVSVGTNAQPSQAPTASQTVSNIVQGAEAVVSIAESGYLALVAGKAVPPDQLAAVTNSVNAFYSACNLALADYNQGKPFNAQTILSNQQALSQAIASAIAAANSVAGSASPGGGGGSRIVGPVSGTSIPIGPPPAP